MLRSRASSGSPLVSFVVPVRNEREAIEDCVQALLAQDLPPDQIEIVVAEGRSSDGTRAILDRLSARDPRVKVVDNPTGRTPDALNLAILASSGKFIGAISGHSRVAADYASRCLNVMRKTDAWSVGGRMEQSSTTPFGRAAAAAAGSRFGVGDSAFHYADVPGPVETVFPGFWPRWVFEQVGLFDPELIRNQDDELSYRIRAAGGIVWFDPGIRATYRPRESWPRLFDQYRQYGKFKVRVFQKHIRAARLRHLIPGIFVGSLLLTPLALAIPWLSVIPLMSASVYVAANLVFSARVSRRTQTRMVDVMKAFAGMHLGYGLGFLQGVLAYAPRWLRSRAEPPVPRLETDGE
jgi:glycosyltransferase involved in cell wall biosynthesis